MSRRGFHSRTAAERRLLTLGVLGGVLIVYALVIYGGVLEGSLANWWSDIAWTVASLATGLKSLQTASRQLERRIKLAWLFFALAALSWFVAMLFWDYYELVRQEYSPFPTIADVFFLGYAPLFIVGAFLYRSKALTTEFTLIQIGNLGMIMCAIFAVCFSIFLVPYRLSDESALYKNFALSFPFAYWSSFFFALFCYWFYVWSENRGVFRLLLLAVAMHAVAETLYSFTLFGKTFEATSYINMFWFFAFALQYWAAFEQDELQRLQGPPSGGGRRKRLTKDAEAITPALCLIAVVLIIAWPGEILAEASGPVLLALILLYAVFLAMREWWISRVQMRMIDAVELAKADLEARVEGGTSALAAADADLQRRSELPEHTQGRMLRQERLATIGQLTAALSHELRHPLGASRSAMDAIKLLSPQGDPRLKRAIALAERSQKRSEKIIDELLSFTRVQALNAEDTLIDDWLGRFLDELPMPPGIAQHRALDSAAACGVDRDRFRQALANVIDNACQAMEIPPPGQSQSRRTLLSIATRQANGRLEITIGDNGCGISPDELANIFEPLYSTKSFGVGLGLPVAKQILEEHGGGVRLNSEVGRGTEVVLWLPLVAQADQAA